MKGVCGLWKSGGQGGSKWLIGSKNCEAIMHRVKKTVKRFVFNFKDTAKGYQRVA